MKIDEFMLLNRPEEYDISGEFAIEDYLKSTPCERYIIYKAYTLDNKWADIFCDGKYFSEKIKSKYTKRYGRKILNWIDDPDCASELLAEAYMKLWPFMYDEENQKFWSDTMSSVQYTMADVFEAYIESENAKRNRLLSQSKQNCTIRYMVDYFAKISNSENIDECIKSAAREIEKIENINAFLSAWHTIGNYCPVPKGFNSPRSNFGKHDLWDLTLMILRKWYLTQNRNSKEKILIEDLFHFNKKADVSATQKWLKYFGDGENGWKNFVDTFLFQDWVYTDTYDVIPLYKGHNWSNAVTPINNLDTFLTNYSQRIFNRGRRILFKLAC